MNFDQLDINSLLIFHTVVEQGSIQKAKDVLKRTQPAITLRLAKIEEQLKVRLFEQKRPEIKLTSDGMLLYRWTSSLRKLIEKNPLLLPEKDAAQRSVRVPVRIGTYTSISDFLIAGALGEISKIFPDFSLNSIFDDPYDLFAKLKSGSLDLIVLPKHFQTSTEIRREFSIPQNTYALLPERKHQKDLSSYKWLIFNNPKDILLQTLNDVLFETVPNPEIRWELSKLTSAVQAVEEGAGAVVVPQFVLCKTLSKVRAVPLTSQKTRPIPMECYTYIGAASSHERVQTFIRCLEAKLAAPFSYE